jgi:hypothetical protein
MGSLRTKTGYATPGARPEGDDEGGFLGTGGGGVKERSGRRWIGSKNKAGLLFVNKKKQKNFPSNGDTAVSAAPPLQGG